MTKDKLKTIIDHVWKDVYVDFGQTTILRFKGKSERNQFTDKLATEEGKNALKNAGLT